MNWAQPMRVIPEIHFKCHKNGNGWSSVDGQFIIKCRTNCALFVIVHLITVYKVGPYQIHTVFICLGLFCVVFVTGSWWTQWSHPEVYGLNYLVPCKATHNKRRTMSIMETGRLCIKQNSCSACHSWVIEWLILYVLSVSWSRFAFDNGWCISRRLF